MAPQIVGVAQVINKRQGTFDEKDEKVFASYLGFCGIAIYNAQLFEQVQLENKRNEVGTARSCGLFSRTYFWHAGASDERGSRGPHP